MNNGIIAQSQVIGLDTDFVHTANSETITGPKTFTGGIIQQSTTQYESAILGSNLLTSSNWTTTGWTGSFSVGFTHTTGNTTSLTNSLAATIGNIYQISIIVTNRSAGTFTINFGGVTSGTYSATTNYGIKAINTNTLSIIPTTDFNGTLVISIQQVTAPYSPIYTINDNTSTPSVEIRNSSNTLNNIFYGKLAGEYNTVGNMNLGIGSFALQYNVTGYANVGVGVSALFRNISGYGNVALGQNAMLNNTSGFYNMAIGSQTLQACTTASGNVGVGAGCLSAVTTGGSNIGIGGYVAQSITTGSNNIGIGPNALYKIATTSGNIGIGFSAGWYLADGSTSNTNSAYSMYLGYGSRASIAGVTNEIAIGYNAIGSGSNTTTIGSSATVRTYTKGYLNIPTATPTSSSATGTTGDICWDANYIYVCTATNAWKRSAISTW